MDNERYLRWRDRKFGQSPVSIDELIVEVGDLHALTPGEHAAILDRCKRSNLAIYASRTIDPDMRRFGRQFGLESLDANWLSGEDGVSRIAVSKDGQGYIPYTDKPIKWHTDGYYNPPERKIRAMLLHCVRSASLGGENRLMDHEILYCLLRDENPDFVRALSEPDAMTIPERMGENHVARKAETGSVFSFDSNENLHMRYTARTRSIAWKQDGITLAAVAAIETALSSPSPYIFHVKLEPGMGLICNNVLHDRAGFSDETRLLYRARYYGRVYYRS
ncbi:MAG: TauD/TfdA family dioxygenase [Burkholderiales bacterium]|nr:TauD/TfdA family dioxygenase [Burkholderiales bacterium]